MSSLSNGSGFFAAKPWPFAPFPSIAPISDFRQKRAEVTMKAIQVHQFGEPEVLQLQEIPIPQPAAGQVLVRLHAIGVNPVDTYWRTGANPTLSLPFTPGLDGAGLVEQIGEGVEGLAVGDRVYLGGSVTGTYAEWVVARAPQIHSLPQETSFAAGAALSVPYGTAHRALFHRAQAKAGETVLIHGASGGVGVAAIQFARALGLTIIGTAGSARGRELALAQGAHHVLDHTAPNYLDAVASITQGRGADLILELLSNVNLGKDLSVLARSGRVVVIGSRGKVEITPRDLMTREADIRGMSLFNVSDNELQGIHAAIRSGLASGALKPVIAQEFPLAQAPAAHLAVLQPGAHGKILLRP